MDGAVTPHVLAYEERLSNFKRAGESGEEGGSAASVAIAEGLTMTLTMTHSRKVIQQLSVTWPYGHESRVMTPQKKTLLD